MAHRFVNRTNRPLMLPNKRGGKKCFRPDEGTTDPWYSRFVGDGMLSRETSDGKPARAARPRPAVRANTNRKVRDSTVRVPPQRVADPGPLGVDKRGKLAMAELLQTGCQVQCEKAQQTIAGAPHWVSVGAIYYCRYCDHYTQDLNQIEGHVRAYHGIHEMTHEPEAPAEEIADVVDSHEALQEGAKRDMQEMVDEVDAEILDELEVKALDTRGGKLGDQVVYKDPPQVDDGPDLAALGKDLTAAGMGVDAAEVDKAVEEAEAPEPAGIPLEQVDMPKKARKALKAAGYSYAHEVARLTDEALLQIKGIGPSMSRRVRAAVETRLD